MPEIFLEVTIETRVLATLVYKLHPQLSSMILAKKKLQTSTLVKKRVGCLFTNVHNKII